jgi:DNA-binding CsgD family transcriptional regulator
MTLTDGNDPDVGRLRAGQLIASHHADGGMRRVTDCGRADLVADLHRYVLEHEAQLSSLLEQVLHDDPQPATFEDQIPLTAREAQVLPLLVTGRTYRQTGAELHLVGATVRSHLRSIYQKLGVTTRTQAAIRALELGLVTRVGPDRNRGSERRPRARLPPVAATGLVSASRPRSLRRACRLSAHGRRRRS